MIIGITGTDGAGKGAVVEYLVSQHNFTHCSARALITEEITRRGLPVDRAQMRLVANDLRRQHGNDYVVTQYLQQYVESEQDLVIESIRALAEAETLKHEGGILLAIDADQQLRYERISARQSESDRVTFEAFVAHEALEMNDTDPNGMQKAAVMASADVTIMNNGPLAELHAAVDAFLASVSV
jgi:dephospho-CoA kinase